MKRGKVGRRHGPDRKHRPRRTPSTQEAQAPAASYNRLLACLKRSEEPLSLPEILRRLEMDPSMEPALRRQMEYLEKQGIVFSHRRGRWTMHSRARVVIGRLSSPRRTYGFVNPEDGEGEDLYVSGHDMNGARHGDLVMARLSGPKSKKGVHPGSTSGEVMAVLERRSPFVAGLYHGDARGGIVIPRDERVAAEIHVDRAPTGAEPQGRSRDGVVVWTEITAPEDRFQPARGRIVSVLGAPDAAGVDKAVIEKSFDLPGAFPPTVESEAARLGADVPSKDLAGREDFTGSMVVTVDPVTARDFDDAVSLVEVETPAGRRSRLTVHIADVSHYVPEGGVIDAEALSRGTSVYFPGYNIPMLPVALSSGLCSLLPRQVRLVQSVEMDFDESGKRVGYRFADGFIRSVARLTYEQLDDILAGRAVETGAEVAGMLKRMEVLCRALRARRMRRGSLDLNLPETDVIVDDDGNPVELRVTSYTVSHQLIEEFMLAANETVAEHLQEKAVPTLYRVHEDPDPAGIDEVEEGLSGMGFTVRPSRGTTSARIRGLLEMFRGRPEEPAVAMMILRSLKLARYSPDPLGHFGLATQHYTHFTSPIRRYPDLVVHRSLRRARRPARAHVPDSAEAGERFEALALECSRLERRAEAAERAMVDWKKAVYMKQRIGQEYQAMVTGATAETVFLTLEGLGVEGMMPSETGRARPVARSAARSARPPRWRLGDRLRVRVQAVDTFRARVLLKPLSTG